MLPTHYQLITKVETLEDALLPLKESSRLAIDTETSGLDPHTSYIRLLQIASNKTTVLLDLPALGKGAFAPITELLTSSALKILHNGSFDLKFLKVAGLPMEPPYFDTMLASQLLTNGLKGVSHSLLAVTQKYLLTEISKQEQRSDWTANLTIFQLDYAANDVQILLALHSTLQAKLQEAGLLEVAKFEFSCLPAVAQMEVAGMRVNKNKLEELKHQYEQEAIALKKEVSSALSLRDATPLFPELTTQINLNSPKQVIEALHKLGIKAKSTSAEHLSLFAAKSPLVSRFLKYRQTEKALSTYINKLAKHIHPVTERIHPSINQIGAAKGRMSFSNPPLQQIPHTVEFRSLFVPAMDNVLVVADYNQIELRILANLSGDRMMCQAYQQGLDLHCLTASLLLSKSMAEVTSEERKIAKPINFGLSYGMSAKKLVVYARTNYGVELTLYQATSFRKRFFDNYCGLQQWHKAIKEGRRSGARTKSGRRRLWAQHIPFTEAVNHPVQGLSADIIKQALGNLFTALKGTSAQIISAVHDEILVECPTKVATDVAEILTSCMKEAGDKYLTPIPCEVEARICESWAEKS